MDVNSILNKNTILKWSEDVASELKTLNAQQKKSKIENRLKEKLGQKISELNLPIELLLKFSGHNDNKLIMPIEEIANELISKPEDIPSLSLTYYTQHEIHKNSKQVWEQGHIFDLHHLAALPYVDFITVDKQMHHYISTACNLLKVTWAKKAILSDGLNKIIT